MPDPREIAHAFALDQPLLDVHPYGAGIINDTFLVTCAGKPMPQAVLQRINPRVFPHPERIMRNLRTLYRHLEARQAALPPGERHLRLPAIIPARNGQDWFVDDQGGFWRTLEFIGASRTLERISHPGQARELGWALGRFHRLTADLDPTLLHQSLPGFHATPAYLERLDRAVAGATMTPDDSALEEALAWVEARRQLAPVLQQACRAGLLPLRVVHGDPKLNNLLFDPAGARALGLIDLDTVQPGLVHYDLGDCVRSGCNTAGEASSKPRFDLELCRTLLEAYLAEAREFLHAREYPFLYNAICLLPFELGLRFLTDHLEGDRYFKVHGRGQNLQRALTQFRLMQDIEVEGERIHRMVSDLARGKAGGGGKPI
jgi:Ser/Thr protein kinase RdoA (MazF antagonist)